MRWLREVGALLSAAAAAPIGGALLAARPAWRAGLRERLGTVTPLEAGAVWVHAASVGETAAALRLVDALLTEGERVFLSVMTATAHVVVQRSRPDLSCVFAPLPHVWCARELLRRRRPSLLILVETELWPAWLAEAEAAGVPVAVISGRLSRTSVARYRRLGPLFRRSFQRLAVIGARSKDDAERFAALGVPENRISVTGDLKFAAPARLPGVAPDLERMLGDVPLFVAGSTHAGEESAVLHALERIETLACISHQSATTAAHLRGLGHDLSLRALGVASATPALPSVEIVPQSMDLHGLATRSGEKCRLACKAALVLAPRHLERIDEVCDAVRAAGRPLLRRSQWSGAALQPGQVLVLDSLGELAGLYGRAAAAFVGGSWVPRGGHNLLEPLFHGCPVFYGPFTENVGAARFLVETSGAGDCVADADALAQAWFSVLQNPEAARARGAAGRRALEAHRGAVERSLLLLRRVRGLGA